MGIDKQPDVDDRRSESYEEFRFRYYSLIITERGEEIRIHIKTVSMFLIELIVISIAFLEVAFVHGPASLLLILPSLLFYFFYLIWNEYVMMFAAGNYLRDEVECHLKKAYGVEGWESYLSHLSHDRDKVGVGLPLYLFMALPFILFPLASIVFIAGYLSTLPLGKIYYLKADLLPVSVIYGVVLLVLSLFLYRSNVILLTTRKKG